MAARRARTIAEYIDAAPPAGRANLQRLYEILKAVAPDAQEAIKWGNPFFVEPRFLFAFSAHKAHLNFVLTKAASAQFAAELAKQQTTANMLQVRYDEPLPEALIRKIARWQLRAVRERTDDSFW